MIEERWVKMKTTIILKGALILINKRRKEVRMNTIYKQFITVFIGVIVLISPVWGITYGDPDDGGHPFVAAVVGINTEDEAVRGRCSGALIQLEDYRSAILTAGHCADFWFAVGNDAVGITFDPFIGDDIDNSMENSLDPSNYFTGGTVVLHPDYGPPGSWNPQNDLAIVVFNQSETQEIANWRKAERSPGSVGGVGFF